MNVAMRTITAYHSVHHEYPLIVLPSMKLMYFANHRENGFHVALRGARLGVRNGKDIYQLLENARLQDGGDFLINFRTGRAPSLEISEADSNIRVLCTAHSFLWREFVAGLKITQRFIRLWLFRRKFSHGGLDPFNLRKIKEFILTDRARRIPSEIIDIIVETCIHRFKPSDDLHNKFPFRRVETKAFHEIASIKRELIIP